MSCSDFYLRQVNGVNGGDTVFVRCVSVCLSVCLCACTQQTGQSDQFKTVKATDFKFDMLVSRDSPVKCHDPLKIQNGGVARIK